MTILVSLINLSVRQIQIKTRHKSTLDRLKINSTSVQVPDFSCLCATRHANSAPTNLPRLSAYSLTVRARLGHNYVQTAVHCHDQVGTDRRLKYVLPLKYVLRLRYVRTSI